MNYELYDTLTIEDKEYIISSIIVYNDYQYFLLTDASLDEGINGAKIVKQALINNLEPDMLYPVVDEQELEIVKNQLENAMIDNLKNV